MAWQAILGGALSLGASALNQGISGANTRRGREWQEVMYERQLRDQLKYNSPNYQVAQMKNSGLNPYLLSDGLTNYSASAPSAPPVAHGQIDASIPMQTALTSAQIDNIEADTEKKKAETEKTDTEVSLNKITMENLDAMQKTEIYKMDAEISKIITDTEFTFMNAQKLEKDCQLIDKQIELCAKQANLTDEQINNLKADTYSKYVYASLEKQKVDMMEFNTNLSAVGMQLTAQGLQLEAAKFRTETRFRKIELALQKALQDHNIKLDWANFCVSTLTQCANVALSAIPVTSVVGKGLQRVKDWNIERKVDKDVRTFMQNNNGHFSIRQCIESYKKHSK